MISLFLITAAFVVFGVDAWMRRSLLSLGLALLTWGAFVMPKLGY